MGAEGDLLARDGGELLLDFLLLGGGKLLGAGDVSHHNAPGLVGKAAINVLDGIEELYAALIHQQVKEIQDGPRKLSLKELP